MIQFAKTIGLAGGLSRFSAPLTIGLTFLSSGLVLTYAWYFRDPAWIAQYAPAPGFARLFPLALLLISGLWTTFGCAGAAWNDRHTSDDSQ